MKLLNGKEIRIAMEELRKHFEPTEVEWRIGSTSKDKKKGLAFCYLESRAIMDRLDEVFGLGGYKISYRPWHRSSEVITTYNSQKEVWIKGQKQLIDTQVTETQYADSQICTISYLIVHDDGTREWISVEDGANSTDFESVKGGLSSALKRTAVCLGIGRYLYDLPSTWVELDNYSNIEQNEKGRLVQVLKSFKGKVNNSTLEQSDNSEKNFNSYNERSKNIRPASPKQVTLIKNLAKKITKNSDSYILKLEKAYGENFANMTLEQASKLIEELQGKLEEKKAS